VLSFVSRVQYYHSYEVFSVSNGSVQCYHDHLSSMQYQVCKWVCRFRYSNSMLEVAARHKLWAQGMYACIHACMCVWRTCICTRTHTHTLSHTHTRTHAHALAHTHTRTHTHMHTRTGQPFDFTKVYSFGEARHKYYRLYSKRTHSIVREHIL